MTAFNILFDRTTTGFGSPVSTPTDQTRFDNLRSFQSAVEGPAPVAATVKVYGCNEASAPVLVATVTLSGTGTIASEVFADDYPYDFYTGEIVSRSTGAKVSVVGSI
jgi:hypothetical protein